MSKPLDPASFAKNGSEQGHQVALFVWASQNYPVYPCLRLMYHIPNGGKRDKITAANLKAAGVKAGVPDLCLPVPIGPWHGLYIELKAPGKGASDEQLEYIVELRKQGYGACVVVGWQAARDTILAYLNWKG